MLFGGPRHLDWSVEASASSAGAHFHSSQAEARVTGISHLHALVNAVHVDWPVSPGQRPARTCGAKRIGALAIAIQFQECFSHD